MDWLRGTGEHLRYAFCFLAYRIPIVTIFHSGKELGDG